MRLEFALSSLLFVSLACTGGEGGGGEGGGGGPVDGEPAELAGILDAHNAVRAAKGVGPMTWDDDLAAIGDEWLQNCLFEHNDGRSDDYPGYVGENLYAASFVPTADEVVSSWASEEADYDYESNSCSGVCGHYTQVVWANSTKLGCAIKNCPGERFENIVICNYSPGGNFNGERPY